MADTIPGDNTSTVRLALNQTLTGQIDTSGDHDWYKVRLVAGQTYSFSTAQNGAAMDTTLTLRDAAGNQLAFDDDGGPGLYSLVSFTATTTGTYFLDAGAFNTGVGTFDVTMVKSQPPEPLQVFDNDQIANQLTDDFWTFFGGARRSFDVAPGEQLTVNITALTADGKGLAREALAMWTDVTGISFRYVNTTAQITFDDNQSGAFSNSSVSGATITSSIVNVGLDWLNAYGTDLDTYSFQTYIHEIGHAIGLGHAGDYNGSAAYPTDAKYANDAWNTTIMSYFSPTENTYFGNQGFTYQFVGTPMAGDAVATTDLYGANSLTRIGDTTYGFNNTSGRDIYDAAQYPTITYAVYDNGGIDTLDYSGFSANQLINLHQETFSNFGGRVGNMMIARGTVIENAIGGSGADVLVANSAANTLTGNAGADTFRFETGDLAKLAGKSDTIANFEKGSDQIDLSGFDAIRGTGAVDQFTFIGRAAFSNTAGELRFTTTAASTTISGDTNGDGTADFVLKIGNKVVLAASDFILSPQAEPLNAGRPLEIAPHKWEGIQLEHGTIGLPGGGHMSDVDSGKWHPLDIGHVMLV